MSRGEPERSRELEGCTVVVTRPAGQAPELSQGLRRRGARVLEASVISFAEPESWAGADRAIGRLETYDRVVFTSVNAVDRFLARMAALGHDAAELRFARLAAIGAATAERLAAHGLGAEDVPSSARAEGLVDLLEAQGGLEGSRILIPRAAVAREILPEALRAAGALVDVAAVYRTVPVPASCEVREALARRAVDVVAFTSGSSVASFVAGAGGCAALRGVLVAVIGPVTAEAARGHGLEPAVVAEEASQEALVEGIVRVWPAWRAR